MSSLLRLRAAAAVLLIGPASAAVIDAPSRLPSGVGIAAASVSALAAAPRALMLAAPFSLAPALAPATLSASPAAPIAAAAAPAEAPSGEAAAAPFADVMLGVFDADDNLWLNANGVWVFKKGAGRAEKLRIPSEEFAHVRQTVGKSGPYADYEYWNDQREGSFWEFYDQPGRNPLLENLKRMVATHAPEQWQGKSWPAFRAMLKANPAGVHILTASGLSRENFLEGLRFLKDQGFIDALPPAENIQCVGNPDHPFYASTDSPSKAKLLTMKHLVVGPAQKRAEALKAQGRKPPLLLGPDGVALENLMPVGFSDDDPGNIAAMKDGSFDADGRLVEKGLAAEYRDGSWPDVKISLFDSDPEDPAAVNTVIKRDGTLRPRAPADDALELAPAR